MAATATQELYSQTVSRLPTNTVHANRSSCNASCRARRINTSLSRGRCGLSGGAPPKWLRFRLPLTGVTVPSPPAPPMCCSAPASSAAAARAATEANEMVCGACTRGWGTGGGGGAKQTAARRERLPLPNPGCGGDEHGVCPPLLLTRSMRASGVMSTELPKGVRALRLGLESLRQHGPQTGCVAPTLSAPRVRRRSC